MSEEIEKPGPRSRAPRVPKKDYQNFLDSLKDEWSLFWAAIIGDEAPVAEKTVEELAIKNLSPEQLRQVIRTLSNDRRRIHRRLEAINKEIEENTLRLQTLELVGGEKEDTLKEIERLSDLGLQISSELEKLNIRLKEIRRSERTSVQL